MCVLFVLMRCSLFLAAVFVSCCVSLLLLGVGCWLLSRNCRCVLMFARLCLLCVLRGVCIVCTGRNALFVACCVLFVACCLALCIG